MNRTTIVLFVLLCSLYACGNRNHESKKLYNKEDDLMEPQSMQFDSLKSAEFDKKITNENIFSSSSGSSISNSKQEINNMRSFDPTSEDDMDDNGMRRYMENNDDEGWD